MFFNSLNRKLKKSYSVVNPEIGQMVFPNGEAEYIYVGTMLDTLFVNRDVFDLLKMYSSVYTYYKSSIGNTAETYIYAKKRTGNVLSDSEIKTLIAFVMFNLTGAKIGISDPIAAVRQYRGFVNSYIETVEKIQKYKWSFEPDTVDAGSSKSPLLVNGVCGVHKYIESLDIPNVEKITYQRTSSRQITNKDYDISYVIDEYTLYNETDSSEIAKLWFNIYGTENTNIQPACLSGKIPFSATNVTSELFAASVKEAQAIEKIIKDEHVSYDSIKVTTATFVYLYVVWTFSFKSIRVGQSEKVQKIYTKEFVEYIKNAFENAPYKMVLDSENIFKEMLKRVDYRVRTSYQSNNYTLLDDGLSNEFLQEFISDTNVIEKIQPTISKRIMSDWVALGEDANQRYLM